MWVTKISYMTTVNWNHWEQIKKEMEHDSGSVAFRMWKGKATSDTVIASEEAWMRKGQRWKQGSQSSRTAGNFGEYPQTPCFTGTLCVIREGTDLPGPHNWANLVMLKLVLGHFTVLNACPGNVLSPRTNTSSNMGSQALSKERIWKSFGENTWKEVRGLTLETSAGIQFWKTVETNPRNVDLVFHETHRVLHRFEQSPNKNPAFCCCYLARIGLIFFLRI